MSPAPFTITCGRCGGCGRIPLPKHLRETLTAARAVAARGGELTTKTIGRELGDLAPRGATGACNRVAALVELGLLVQVGRSPADDFKTRVYALPEHASNMDTAGAAGESM